MAQGTETPDYPESPAPPHSEASQQQLEQLELAEQLEPPPLGRRLPHKILFTFHPTTNNFRR